MTESITSSEFQIKESLASLEQALLSKDGDMPTLLRTIHRAIKQDPESVTLLSDDECSILVNGLKEVTRSEIAAKVLKSRPKKAMSKLTIDDL